MASLAGFSDRSFFRGVTPAPKSLHPPNFVTFCVTEATSQFLERDTLILLLGVTCGMRITEVARLEVASVLLKSGTRRWKAPGSITKGAARGVSTSHMSGPLPRLIGTSSGATSAASGSRWIGASTEASCHERGWSLLGRAARSS